MNHKGPSNVEYGIKFRDLSFEYGKNGKFSVAKSNILELKVRKSVTEDGVETWNKVIHKSLKPSRVLLKEITRKNDVDVNVMANEENSSNVKANGGKNSRVQGEKEKESLGERPKSMFLVCSSANAKEQTMRDKEIVNVMIEDREEEKFEVKKVETVKEEGKCYEVCFSEIVKVLKQEILGQRKEEKDILSGFYKAIEEMEESEVGFVITSKHRYQSGMKEDTFIKNTSFRCRGGVMCKEKVSFYRSVNVEDSKESVRELEKQLPEDFFREGMVACGFPELLMRVLEKEFKE